jgi:hypothetical protein
MSLKLEAACQPLSCALSDHLFLHRAQDLGGVDADQEVPGEGETSVSGDT